MSKAFTTSEKTAIRESLLSIGFIHFDKFGIRGARVEDICREVGIAKGSFYSFFRSKEVLFMTIADAADAKHKTTMRLFLLESEGTPKFVVAEFFDFVMDKITSDPILKIVRDPGELSYLIRKLPPESLLENARRDREFVVEIETILSLNHGIKFADSQTLEDLMTLMTSLSMHADFISAAGNFDSTIKLMRDLFVTRLLKGPIDD